MVFPRKQGYLCSFGFIGHGECMCGGGSSTKKKHMNEWCRVDGKSSASYDSKNLWHSRQHHITCHIAVGISQEIYFVCSRMENLLHSSSLCGHCDEYIIFEWYDANCSLACHTRTSTVRCPRTLLRCGSTAAGTIIINRFYLIFPALLKYIDGWKNKSYEG